MGIRVGLGRDRVPGAALREAAAPGGLTSHSIVRASEATFRGLCLTDPSGWGLGALCLLVVLLWSRRFGGWSGFMEKSGKEDTGA